MKKIMFIMLTVFMLAGCTSNQMARKWGGKTTIELEPGQKLVEATWKNDNLWYLTEDMEEGYVPKTKTFKEDSNYGCLEGSVVFVESRK